MSDVTRILSRIEEGDLAAAEQLLPLVYDELRKLAAARLAQENPGQTLQSTALVHEAYLRLIGKDSAPAVRECEAPAAREGEAPAEPARWNSRGHFFGAAAEAMRRILIEAARSKRRLKRGGGWQRLSIVAAEQSPDAPPWDVLALDEALAQLEREKPEKAQLVKLRYFSGLTMEEAAEVLGISATSADRYWKYARAWLAQRLRESAGDCN